MLMAPIILLLFLFPLDDNSSHYTQEELALALLHNNTNVKFNLETEEGKRLVMSLVYLSNKMGYKIFNEDDYTRDDYTYNGYCHVIRDSLETHPERVKFMWDGYCPYSIIAAKISARLRGHLLDGYYEFIGIELSQSDKKVTEELSLIISEKPEYGTLSEWLCLISSIDFLFDKIPNTLFVYEFIIKNSQLDKNFININYQKASIIWEQHVSTLKPLILQPIS